MYWHTLGIKWSNHVPKNVIITCASVTHEIFISCICGKCSDVMYAMIYWDILRKNTEMFNFVTYQLWWIYSFLLKLSSVVCEDVMYDMMARWCKRNATGYLDGSGYSVYHVREDGCTDKMLTACAIPCFGLAIEQEQNARFVSKMCYINSHVNSAQRTSCCSTLMNVWVTARELTGLEFGTHKRAVTNWEKWRKLVAKSSVVPQHPKG